MKLKTMDIQKFLLTGWCPKMAPNGKALAKKPKYNYKCLIKQKL